MTINYIFVGGKKLVKPVKVRKIISLVQSILVAYIIVDGFRSYKIINMQKEVIQELNKKVEELESKGR